MVTPLVMFCFSITLGNKAGLAELPNIFTIAVRPVITNIIHGANIFIKATKVKKRSAKKENPWVNIISFFLSKISAKSPPYMINGIVPS